MNNMELFFEDHKLQFLTKLDNTKKKYMQQCDERMIKWKKICILGDRSARFQECALRMLPHK